MSQDVLQDQPTPEPGGSAGPGRLVIAGVLGACALGGCLGFWARPTAPGEAPGAAKAAEVLPQRALEIVVADAPLSPGQPLDVLPAGAAREQTHAAPPPIAPPLDQMAPRRPASGLVRVDAPVAVAAAPAAALAFAPPKPAPDLKAVAARAERQRQAEAERRAEAARKAEAAQVAEAARLTAAAEQKAEARRIAAERASAKAEAAHRAEARLAEQRRSEAHKVALRAQAAEEARQTRLAKAEAARAAKLAQAQKLKAQEEARAEKAEAVRVAKLEAARQAKLEVAREKAREEAKAARMAALVKALKAAPRRIAAEARQLQRQRDAELADAHALKTAKAQVRVAPRAESPVRLAKATCASSDPGEALVCADSRLGARDRQLQQAYRSAEAAGVSPEALRRQQSRWLQARAAAAREDRWAVEDVYEARIAELKELSRDQN